jgi:hypothetical protein
MVVGSWLSAKKKRLLITKEQQAFLQSSEL